MENTNLNVEPNVKAEGTIKVEGKRGLGGLSGIIALMIIGALINIGVTIYTCSENMWFDCYISYISVAETSVTTLLTIMSIVAIVRRSDKAISLLYASLTTFIIAKILLLLASFAFDSQIVDISPMPQVVGLVIAIAIMVSVSNSDNCKLLFPPSQRKLSLFGWLLVALYVVIQGCSLYVNSKMTNDPSSVFVSDKAYFECCIAEMNSPENAVIHDGGGTIRSKTYLEDDTLVIEYNQDIHLLPWEELIVPSATEKKNLANEFTSTLVADKFSRCLVETIVRNNYSILIKYNINDDVKYNIELPADYLKSFL